MKEKNKTFSEETATELQEEMKAIIKSAEKYGYDPKYLLRGDKFRLVLKVINAIVGMFLVCSVSAQNYGTIGMPGGTLQGGELDSVAISIFEMQRPDGSSMTGYQQVPSKEWTKRYINTTIIDQIGITVTADSVFTLPAGSYLIDANGVLYGDNGKHRLYNNTSASVISYSLSTHGTTRNVIQHASGALVAGSDLDISFDVYNNAVSPVSNSLGEEDVLSDGSPEIYVRLKIIKLK